MSNQKIITKNSNHKILEQKVSGDPPQQGYMMFQRDEPLNLNLDFWVYKKIVNK